MTSRQLLARDSLGGLGLHLILKVGAVAAARLRSIGSLGAGHDLSSGRFE
jgi:hypothetical protein